MEAERISRDVFMEKFLEAERTFEKRLAEAQNGLYRLEMMKLDVWRAELHGLRVEFYESDESIMFTVEAKEPIGFKKGK